MMIAAAIVVPLVLMWVAVNVVGWLSTRGGPFSWRVLFGADVYYRWLDRRERN